MRNLNKTTYGIIFVVLLLFISGFTYFIVHDETTYSNQSAYENISWKLTIEEVPVPSDSLGMLTEHLYRETRGERRTEVLETLIIAINENLNYTSQPVSFLLTDLLRDLSLEHPESKIRLQAYVTMIIALESEREPGEFDSDIVLK